MHQNKDKSASTARLERLDDLEDQISNTTAVLKESELARSTCCIYTVPNTLTKNNDKGAYYHPQVVSIGPLHHSETHVMAMEKYKLEFLSVLLDNTKLHLDDLLESIRPLQNEATACYPKEINFESLNGHDRFLKLMVLDGCFLIELFRKAKNESKHPLATMSRAVPYIYGDLLLLQNQIPFFVLENLFQFLKRHESYASETSKMPEESHDSLSLFALQFFNKVMQRPEGVIEKFLNQYLPPDQKPLHLLDLVRSSFLTPNLMSVPPKNNESNTQTYRLFHSFMTKLRRLVSVPPKHNESNTQTYRLFHSFTKLRRSGIKLKLKEADSFLEVTFENGEIKMPSIIMDYCMRTFLVNCVAFEQLHKSSSKQFTVYASFLDCLVDTTWDVNPLCEENIFHSYFGKYDDVVKFINNMGMDLAFDDDQFYLSQLFNDVNNHYGSYYKKQWASFKRTYFNTPWSFISALAAFVLLVLTFLQTYYTIYAYVHPN